MQESELRYDEALGQVVEYRPVPVSSEDLAQELADAEADQVRIDQDVANLEKAVESIEAQHKLMAAELGDLLEKQEAAHELVAFRKDRVTKFNAVHPNDQVAVDEPASADGEDLAGDESDAEIQDVAPGDEPDGAAGEPEATGSEEVEIAIRRRANI